MDDILLSGIDVNHAIDTANQTLLSAHDILKSAIRGDFDQVVNSGILSGATSHDDFSRATTTTPTLPVPSESNEYLPALVYD